MAASTRLFPDMEIAPSFYVWPQDLAITHFTEILKPYLPFSNPIYNRLLSPQNTSLRHCLFAATFPPSSGSSDPSHDVTNSSLTLLFADRSRTQESQIWLFHTLITQPDPLSQSQASTLSLHMHSVLLFLRDVQIPSAPGSPFSPICRFACLHSRLADALTTVAEPFAAKTYETRWNYYFISLSSPQLLELETVLPPEGFELGNVPEAQLDVVMRTSSIPRQRATLLDLPNCALMDGKGEMVAWGFLGIDGSLATLFVREEWRGRGFANLVAGGLLQGLREGKFGTVVGRDARGGLIRAYDGESGFVHSDVHHGNEASMAVMRRLGGVTESESSYMWIDTSKIS